MSTNDNETKPMACNTQAESKIRVLDVVLESIP